MKLIERDLILKAPVTDRIVEVNEVLRKFASGLLIYGIAKVDLRKLK